MFFTFLIFSSSTTDPKEYINRAVPKLLWFEHLSGPFQLIKEEKLQNSHFKYTIDANGTEIVVIIEPTDKDFTPIWAEVSNTSNSNWQYSPATQEEIDIFANYLSMMVNSMEPPKVKRVVSHRTATINDEIHHQAMLIMEVFGFESLQFMEFKVSKEGKHNFVKHNVIVSDGGEI